MAGWSLACEWWDSSPKPDYEKSQFLLEAVRYLEKGHLEEQIREKLLRGVQAQEPREVDNGGDKGVQEKLSEHNKFTEEEETNEVHAEGSGTLASGIAHETRRKCEKSETSGGKKKFLSIFYKKIKSDTFEGKGVSTLEDLASKDPETEKSGNSEIPKRKTNKYTPMKVVYARNQSVIPSNSAQKCSSDQE